MSTTREPAFNIPGAVLATLVVLVGVQLARGADEASALAAVGATVEGAPTARAVLRLAARHGWRLPISEQVVALLDGRIEAGLAVRALMERDLRPEADG